MLLKKSVVSVTYGTLQNIFKTYNPLYGFSLKPAEAVRYARPLLMAHLDPIERSYRLLYVILGQKKKYLNFNLLIHSK